MAGSSKQLARDARQAVDDGKVELVSAYVRAAGAGAVRRGSSGAARPVPQRHGLG